jgi:hypothetical protein
MANQDKLKALIERIIFTLPMVTAAALSVMVPMITFVLEHPSYNPPFGPQRLCKEAQQKPTQWRNETQLV